MNLEKILAITGKPGLYALKMQTRTGFVAESLIDGKKITVGLRSNVSLLSEISIYTQTAEQPLATIMRSIAIKENEGLAMSHKESNDVLLAYFKEILPDYDEDRVYASDVKKILNWYNMLQAKGLVSKDEPIIENKEAVGEEEVAEEEVAEEEVLEEKVFEAKVVEEEVVEDAVKKEEVVEEVKATTKKVKPKKK